MTTETATPPVSDPNPTNLTDVVVTIGETPEAKPAPAAPTATPENTSEVFEYTPTGDVGLDMALAFVGKAGISSDHPGMIAAEAGDFSILKAALAAKGVQGWEQFVALGEQAVSKRLAAEAATKDNVKKMVVELAGGEQEWAAVQKWAAANATPEEKAEINGLLNKGGLAAKGAVKYLLDAYTRANNVVVNPADPTANASRATATGGANSPLSASEYAAAVRDLNVKLRGRIDDSPEYAKLQARRQAYRG